MSSEFMEACYKNTLHEFKIVFHQINLPFKSIFRELFI